MQKTEEISAGSEILVVKGSPAFAFPSLYLTKCTFIYACVFIYCYQRLSYNTTLQISRVKKLLL